MAQVTQEAGLSMGIANLHFQSKEKLLTETLKFVTDEYNRGQDAILNSDDYPTLTDKTEALLAFDFSPRVTQRNKLAVWYAFWGEAKSRPTYQRICNRTDALSNAAISGLFQAMIEEGGYSNTDADLLATGYTALIDGLWLDLLVAPRQVNREKAYRVARHYLASAFPRHIQLDK
jgi:TetR/AcrR family transcriptional repressor of bet genes